MTTGRRIALTAHAKVTLTERRIEIDWIRRTLEKPDAIEADDARGTLRAFGTVPEREGRVLRVVYVETDDEWRIVTAYLDRNRRADQKMDREP